MYNNHKTQEKNQCLNISDLDFYSETHKLTDDDLNNINGGVAGAFVGGAVGSVVGDFIDSKYPKGGKHRKPGINVGKFAVKALARGGGAALGTALGSFGGPLGAGLAGED
jgi:bacteriocin-like protein